jgi:hypothetical protein
MSEVTFPPEIFEQKNKVQEECRKLQALLDDKVLDTTFILCSDELDINIIPDVFRKEKSIREENVAEDDEEEDEDFEIKPKQNVIFKVDGSQSPPSFMPESQTDSEVQGSQPPEPVTWGSEPRNKFSVYIFHKVKVCVIKFC